MRIILTLIALTWAALLTSVTTTYAQDATPVDPQAPDYVFVAAPDDHATGSGDAPNTLIVYASNMCPHCRDWFVDEWPSVKSELVETEQLRVIFRPLPSAPAQLSMIGFMIAECGGTENYFTNIEHQFERQSAIHEMAQNGGLREEYAAMGAKAGLADEEALNTCLGDEDNLAKIHAAGKRANAAGIRGIPGFILNGTLMAGDQTAASIADKLRP